MKSLFSRISILILVLSWSHDLYCQETNPKSDGAKSEISFRRDVWPIVRRHCRGCHTNTKLEGGLSMDSVADMLKGGDSGPLFDIKEPDSALLIDMITGDQPEMPKGQPALSAAKIDVIRRWLKAGAKDDSLPGGDAPPVRIPETYRFAPAVTAVAISPDGKRLAAACRSEVVLFLDVDAPESAALRLPTESDLLTHVEFSPDGKLLAASGGSPGQYGELRLYNAADGKLLSARRVGTDTLFRGSFAPDSRSIALGSSSGEAVLIPVDPAAPVKAIPLHSDWVFDVAFTPDGKRIVTGGRDKSSKVASVETGKLLRTVDEAADQVTSVASSAEFAFSSGKARTLTGFEYKIALQGVEVTGGGNGSRPITRRNQYAKGMEAQPGPVLDMATSFDRKRLAIAGAYGDVRVYDTTTRQRVALIPGVPSPIYGVSLNQDGTRIAIGSKSGIVNVYSTADAKLIRSINPVPVEKTVAAK
jgi:WD40 repeat protein